MIWGIDSLSVKWAESGEMIRFTYRVVDPEKAKTLGDKRLEPSLIDEQAHVKLTRLRLRPTSHVSVKLKAP